MFKNTKKVVQVFLATLCMVFVVAAPASAAPPCDSGSILTFPAWHSGLALDSDCRPIITELNDVWVVAINAVEVLLQVVAYTAAGFLVWGGFKYMKSRGDPGKIQNSKDAILNAVIGLGISLGSIAIVNFISDGIKGDRVKNGVPVVNAGVGQLNFVMSNIVFPIAGAVCIIIIIIGAIKYTTSEGNSAEVQKAKDTIMYALVGLVFVVMAFAIVQLLLGRFQ